MVESEIGIVDLDAWTGVESHIGSGGEVEIFELL
jgi:hypothetical protein